MPPTGYRDKPNADITDFNGIINAIYNCTWMQCFFSDDLSKDSNNCTKARDKVNGLRHMHDTKIDDGDMISFFDCLLNLLNDPAYLNSFRPAVDACKYLTQLQKDTLQLSEKAINKTLENIYVDRKEEFRGRLIRFYMTTKKTVSVSPLREGRDKPIWDVFVQPKLAHITMEKDGSRTKTENVVHQYKALFYKDEKLNNRVFVQGEPGIGKTTFLTKLALDWCDVAISPNQEHKATFSDVDTLKDFKFLFYISLRDAMDQREVIEMIKTQIIDRIYDGDKREETLNLLPQILERETCIVTMDGLNEWIDCLNKCVIPLLGHYYIKCVSIITSRPWKMTDERIKDSEINSLIEIEGLIDSEELAKHIIHSLSTGNVKSHTEFMNYVNERQLRHFLTSPWLLTVLVNLWMNDKVFTDSLCEINCFLIDILFKNANAKMGYFQKGKPFQCFYNTRFIQQQIDIFDALANAAFKVTFTSNKSLVFTERELLDYMSEDQLKFCLHAGVLTKRYSFNIEPGDAQFSFIHETVQEFMAAYHIANSTQDLLTHKSTQQQDLETVLKCSVLEMSQTILYLCGLDCNKANKLINFLVDDEFLKNISCGSRIYIQEIYDREHLETLQTCNFLNKNVFKSKHDLKDDRARCLALSVLFQRMVIAGCIEAQASGQNDICIQCRHFSFISSLNDSESSALKVLLMFNKSDVQSLILESNVLQISEILTVLKQSKHSLQSIKMTVTPDMNKALHQTRIQEMHITGEIDELSSGVFQSLSKLTTLKIEDSTTVEDILLPYTIQYISLFRCTFTAMFLRRLLEQLSSFEHDVDCVLDDVNVTDCNTQHPFQSDLCSRDMKNIILNLTNCNITVYGLLRRIPIEKLSLGTSNDVTLASEILHTLSNLTKLYLWGTHTSRRDLNLPASLQCISLQKVECSSEWLCGLLITLSLLDHPVTCDMRDVVLQSTEQSNLDESHLPVSDLRSELCSSDMSNIMILVVNGNKGLFELLRETSTGILDLRTAECASLASAILHTLNKLTKLYLWGTYMGRCELNLPVSLQCISLQKVECSSEWLYGLLITLSVLDHPVTCEMHDVVLQSREHSTGDDSHKRISDLRSKYIKILVKNGNMELVQLLRDTSLRFQTL